jgi:asparagine synthase (glutamine-hydrolysing)
MTGICGIINLDGAPLDSRLLRRMADSMSYRGPDRQETWLDATGSVGFGRALLATRAAPELPLAHTHGRSWIAADARIDGQAELKAKLKAKAGGCPPTSSDAELILRAYATWGEDCVRHLIGDFSFALWDARRKRLFCARDPLGFKPFFYAQVGQTLVFSNTLACVRSHPAVTPRLDDVAIADFLLFEACLDPDRTAFAQIRRLGPGTRLMFSCEGVRADEFWSAPDTPVRYRSGDDYVEHFNELLGLAIDDRITMPHVAVMMSGGLDSPVVAARAHEALSRHGTAFELRAHTMVYDRLFEDRERHYAGLAAARMGIPIQFRVADDYILYQRHAGLQGFFPEPANDPLAALHVDTTFDAAARARIALTGFDGDSTLCETPRHYFRALLRNGEFGRLAGGLCGHAITRRRLVPRSWLQRLSPRRAVATPQPQFPAWIDPSLEKRLDLRARWVEGNASPTRAHPVRPYAYRVLDFVRRRSALFDRYDAGLTGAPIEYRHPLLDLRLVEFCLSLPPYPWCVDKEILRRSVKGVLPEEVRSRPKAPLAGYPCVEAIREQQPAWIDGFVACDETSKYIDVSKIPRVVGENDEGCALMNLRPLSLDLWLRRLGSDPVEQEEIRDECA